MSAGVIIETAKAASAELLGQAKASTQFANEVENSTTVDVILSDMEKKQLVRELGFVPIYTSKKNVRHDHSVIYALREIVRAELFKTISFSSATQTLFIGCTSFELSNPTLYGNAANHFSIHGSEAKDSSRIVPGGLKDLMRNLKTRLNKADRLFLAGEIKKKPEALVLRVKGLQGLIDALYSGDFKDIPRVGFHITPKVTRIVSFDSAYNLCDTDYIKLFSDTGANEMYVMGFFPPELLFDDMPENDLYHFYELGHAETMSATRKVGVSFRNGYSDGYVHDKRCWATLMRSKVIRGDQFSLNVEIVSSAGPMRLIKLSKSTGSFSSFRAFELPQHLKYVKVLDIASSYNAESNFKSLEYFSVREEHWWALVHYLLSLDRKAATPVNAITYIKRSMNGVSMSGVTYADAWCIRKEEVLPLAIAGVAFTHVSFAHADEALSEFNHEALRTDWAKFFKSLAMSVATVVTLGAAIPIAVFVKWLFSNSLAEKLVLTPDMVKIAYADVGGKISQARAALREKVMGEESVPESPEEFSINLDELLKELDTDMIPAEKDKEGNYLTLGSKGGCQFCRSLRGKLGSQLIACGYRPDNVVSWEMTLEQTTAFKNEMITQMTLPETPPPLVRVLEDAINLIPASAIKWKGRVSIVKAGPGCGKSYIARARYDEQTLIVAPFSKLRADYMNQARDDGTLRDMTFKTTHKAMKGAGKPIIMVDEWTSFDWRALMIVLHSNGAKSVTLYGDELQTCIQANEGVFIGSMLPGNCETHELMVNFRNPKYIVGLLNRDFGYNMVASSGVLGIPKIRPLSEASSVSNMKVLNFTHVASQFKMDQKTDTVRSNQGGTEESIGLIVSDGDRNLVMNDQLWRVAISRHKKDLVVFVEPGTEMETLVKERLRLNDAKFLANIGSWAKPSLSGYEVDQEDGQGDRDYLVSLMKQCEDKNAPVPILDATAETVDIEWCTADFLGHYRPELVEEYKSFVKLNKDLYVQDKLVRADALIDFAKRKNNGLQLLRRADLSRIIRIPGPNYAAPTPWVGLVEDQHVVPMSQSLNYVLKKKTLEVRSVGKAPVTVTDRVCKMRALLPMSLDDDVWGLILKDFATKSRVVWWLDHAPGINTEVNPTLAGWDTTILDLVARQLGQTVSDDMQRWMLKNRATIPRERISFDHFLPYFEERKIGYWVISSTPWYQTQYQARDWKFMVIWDGEAGVFRAMTEKQKKIIASKIKVTYFFTEGTPTFEGYAADLFKFTVDNCTHRLSQLDNIFLKIERGMRDISAMPGDGDNDLFLGKWKTEDALVPVVHADVPTSQQLLMQTFGFLPPVQSFAPADNMVQPGGVINRPTHPSSNAYMTMDSFSPVFAIYDRMCLNEGAAQLGFLNVPRTGVMPNDWNHQVNARGHPVNLEKRAYKGQALSIGEGLRYFGDNKYQSLQAVAHRYLRKRKAFRYNNQAEMAANKLADLFISERQDPIVIDVHKEADIVREWEFASLQRNYEKRRQGEGEWAAMLVRHHLKDIFKPTKDLIVSGGNAFLLDAVNVMKPGQGISAWSAEANIKFGAITRIINHRWLSSLKSCTTYNNKFSEEEIDEQIADKKVGISPFAKTGVTDGADFDSMQNRFTQQIERRHSAFLGVPEVVLAAYYQHRNDYTMVENGLFAAKARSEKTSGEPGTLLYNSQLGGTVSNAVLRGLGPSVMEIQGDDAKKTQIGLKVDGSVLKILSTYSDFKLKTKIGKNQEFCGNVEIAGTLVPSVHRLYKKVTGQIFKSEKHFYEHKMSLLDKIARIERVGANIAVAASAEAIGVSFGEMDSLYDAVKSFSHVSYEQFLKQSMPIYAPMPYQILLENRFVTLLNAKFFDVRACRELAKILMRTDYSVVESRREAHVALNNFVESGAYGDEIFGEDMRFRQERMSDCFLTEGDDNVSGILTSLSSVLSWRATNTAKDTSAGTGKDKLEANVALAFDQGAQDNTKRFEELVKNFQRYLTNSAYIVRRKSFESTVAVWREPGYAPPVESDVAEVAGHTATED